MEEQKAIDEKLKSQLFSSDETAVLSALKTVSQEGSRFMVEPVLELLVRTNSSDVREVVISQLSQLKIGEMEALFVQKIQSEDFKEYRKELVACMWNSGMNPVDHLHVFTKLATEGDYMTALEVLTLIENLEGPFDHESLTDAFSDVSIYVNEAPADDPKLDLIKSIYGILYAFQEE